MQATSKVLEGVRILDFGRFIAGPFCSALLADFGADVVRIDRVGGSEDRFVMPVAPQGEGAFFLQVNRNKRSMTLDIDRPEGRAIVRRLLRDTDVVVANMPPQTLHKLGLDYEALCAVKPDIILTTATAFGSDDDSGHRVGFDGVGQAMSGAVHISGLPENPMKVMVPVVDFSTALACALGTVIALYERRSSGRGQKVEASLLQMGLNLASGALIEEAVLGLNRQATGNRSPIAGPSDIFRVVDGWIIVQVIGQPLFKRWTRLIGRPELIDDPRFRNDQARGENGHELSSLMSAWCAGRSRDEALHALEQAKIPAGPVYSPRETLTDPSIAASGAFKWMSYPGLDALAPIVSPPVTLSRTSPQIVLRSPTVGEHTDEILSAIGYDPDAIATLRSQGVI